MTNLTIPDLYNPTISSWGLWSRQRQLTEKEKAQKEILEDVFRYLQTNDIRDYARFKNKFENVSNQVKNPLKVNLANCKGFDNISLLNLFRFTMNIHKLELDCARFTEEVLLEAISLLKKNSSVLSHLKLIRVSKPILEHFLKSFPSLKKLELSEFIVTTEEYHRIINPWMAGNSNLQSIPQYEIDSKAQIQTFIEAIPLSVRKVSLQAESNELLKDLLVDLSKKMGVGIESAAIEYTGATPPGEDIEIFKSLPELFPNLRYFKFIEMINFQSNDIKNTYVSWKNNGMDKLLLGSSLIEDSDLVQLISTFPPRILDLGLYSPNINNSTLSKIVPILIAQKNLEKIRLPGGIHFKDKKNTIDPIIKSMGPIFKYLKCFRIYSWDVFNAATLTFIAQNLGSNLEEFNVKIENYKKPQNFWSLEVIKEVFSTVGLNCPKVKKLSFENISPTVYFCKDALIYISKTFHGLEELNLCLIGVIRSEIWGAVPSFIENNPNLHTIYMNDYPDKIKEFESEYPELTKKIEFISISNY